MCIVQNTDLKNLPLMHAAALVQDGHITMACAAQQFGCTINQIGAILAWSKLKKLTEEEIALIDKVISERSCEYIMKLQIKRLKLHMLPAIIAQLKEKCKDIEFSN